MGEKDIAEKTLFDYPDVVADVMNVLLFDGKQVVKEKDIIPTNTRSQYKIENELHEEERDNLMVWKKKGKIRAYIGTEHQTDSEKYETIRVFGYDGTQYQWQFIKRNEVNRSRRKLNRKPLHTDFYPVLTMILYYGMHHWKYRSHLKELIKIPEELEPFISDYIVNNVFEIAWLREEQVQKFQSDFQVIADYFVQKRTKKEYTPGTKVIRHVNATLKLMTVLTKTDWRSEIIKQMEAEGKEITMVSAYAEVEKRGYDRGVEYGKAQMKSAYAEVEKRGYDRGVEYGKAQMKSAYAEVEKRGYDRGVEYGKAQMKSAYAEVEKRGYDRGVEYGKAQMKNAFADGESKNRRDTAGRMLKDGSLPISEIASFTGLSEKEVQNLKKSLNC